MYEPGAESSGPDSWNGEESDGRGRRGESEGKEVWLERNDVQDRVVRREGLGGDGRRAIDLRSMRAKRDRRGPRAVADARAGPVVLTCGMFGRVIGGRDVGMAIVAMMYIVVRRRRSVLYRGFLVEAVMRTGVEVVRVRGPPHLEQAEGQQDDAPEPGRRSCPIEPVAAEAGGHVNRRDLVVFPNRRIRSGLDHPPCREPQRIEYESGISRHPGRSGSVNGVRGWPGIGGPSEGVRTDQRGSNTPVSRFFRASFQGKMRPFMAM